MAAAGAGADTNLQKKACDEFLAFANIGDNSKLIPVEQLTPYALYNISNTTRNSLLDAIQDINKDDLLLIILGETNEKIDNRTFVKNILESAHNLFEQPILKDYDKNITILVIDPTLDTSREIEINDTLAAKKVRSIILMNEIFPLTPIFGPHKHFRLPTGAHIDSLESFFKRIQPEFYSTILQDLKKQKAMGPGIHEALRRMIHTNAILVLNELVKHPSPLVISSRITNICYRSFKYLIDIRSYFNRITKVFHGYTNRGVVYECTSEKEFLLYPDPFKKCSNYADIDKYYYRKNIGPTSKFNSEEKRKLLRDKIDLMNAWANGELVRHLPRGGAHQKRTTNKKRGRRMKKKYTRKGI
jgi:hypothetical protein